MIIILNENNLMEEGLNEWYLLDTENWKLGGN